MPERARAAAVALTGLTLLLGGCMSGRSSLVATQAPRGAAAAQTTGAAASTPLGGSYPVGPSRSSRNLLASSGTGAGRTVLTLQASGAAVGGLRLSSGISTSATTAAGRAAVSITPTLAPAASVGASVAAVTQPLTATASASARTKAGLKPAMKGLAAQPPPGLGVSVRVGG